MLNPSELAAQIKRWGTEFGFQRIAIGGINLSVAETHFVDWLAQGFHGDMHYMEKHGIRRCRPAELQPGTLSVISARMNYFPADAADAWAILHDKDSAYVARYALGRDYHKTLRQRLGQLAKRVENAIGPYGYRVFVDSAPVLERALAENSGLGWIGKHTNVIDREQGSWFFLGEIFVDFTLPHDAPASNHCGTCRRCLDACPTQAIVAPYRLDARRCIAYLTIENKGAIPLEFRTLIGNRIFGCDDCQLVCPWNREASLTGEKEFSPRHGLDRARLITLFSWSEKEFLARTEGSPLRRPGFDGWQRNIAVALGNATPSDEVISALQNRLENSSPMVREHIDWALARLVAQRP